MKNYPALLILSLITVILLACAKGNPYLGKWNGDFDGEAFALEILEEGNAVLTMGSQVSVAKWHIEDAGGIVFEHEDDIATGFLNDDTLLVSEGGDTVSFKRVK